MSDKSVALEWNDPLLIRDFFYIETDRIGSMVAQMHGSGSRNVIVENHNQSSGLGISAGLGAPTRHLLHGKIDASKTNGSSVAETYNPFIPDVMAFTDYVLAREAADDRDYDVSQLRRVIGKIALYDLEAFKRLLSDDGIKGLITSKWKVIYKAFGEDEENSTGTNALTPVAKRKYDRIAAKRSAKETHELREALNETLVLSIAAFFRTLDIPVVGRLTDDRGREFWFTLNKNFLSHVNGELLLKYKGEVPGYWNIVCVVDQVPGEEVDAVHPLDLVLSQIHEIRDELFRIEYLISPLVIYRDLG